jgi:primosomal protein N' (replication factor Y) (superfamily II helicase)
MDNPFAFYVTVQLEGGAATSLDYGVPASLSSSISVGSLVKVPVRGSLRSATVTALKESSSFPKIRPIADVVVASSELPQELRQLAEWMSRYYVTPLSRVLEAILPAAVRREQGAKQQWAVRRALTREELKKAIIEIRPRAPHQAALLDLLLSATGPLLLTQLLEESGAPRSSVTALANKGLISLERIDVERSPLEDQEFFQTTPKRLNDEQQVALDAISQSVAKGEFETHLLFGVTGSGKTEVYLQAIDKVLQLSKGVIVLVPEIALTGQTVERLRSRFEGSVALLHHRLSDGERYDTWHKIRRGEASIVIGARSAIFSPLPDLGLIIVDEEHEASYKQSETALCYHGRDVAVMRGKLANAAVVLGSATPSLESFTNCKRGKYRLLSLSKRATELSLPKVECIDMREAIEKAGEYTLFSDRLITAMKHRFEVGEQTLLLLNRRGYHTCYWCPACGKTVRCPDCDVSLTFHRSRNQLICHRCNHLVTPPPSLCPSCGSDDPLRFRGFGTEQVERHLHRLFPDLRTLRLDADTTRHKGSHEKLLRQFRSGKADVLVGTQMIAKGLHLPQVTLVGVLNPDAALHIPDFRASEGLFQLLTQVAGRAGRGALPGEVIVQTYLPNHPIFELAAKHDYLSFYESEAASRELFGYPPYSHLIKLTFSSEEQQLALQRAEEYRASLLPRLPLGCEALPIIPSGQPRLRGDYRFQLLLRGSQATLLTPLVFPLSDRKVRLSVDVDPISLN